MTRLDPVDDDLLLDRLGRGEPVADAGSVAAILAEWRATLPDSAPVDEKLLAAAMALAPAAPARRTARRFARLSLGIASGVILACGGTAIAAAHAGPGSPLWPITQLLYGDEAESRIAVEAAGQVVADARVAAEQGRFGDAARLLDDATALLPKIHEPEHVQRLRAQLDAVRALLPPGPVPTEPAVSPAAPTPGSPRPPTAPSSVLPAPAVESGPGPGVVPPTQAPAPTGTPSPSVLVPLPPLPRELVPEVGPAR